MSEHPLPPVITESDLSPAQQRLIAAARAAREHAHAPYSLFRVGAAVLDAAGSVHVGCNVESPSFGLTMCAERVALFAARAAGGALPVAIAVVATAADGRPATPCGACRQVILDLGGDIEVLAATDDGRVCRWRAADLLPDAFTSVNLPERER